MRGRNRSKGPNPLTRAYESNGPDVKIRGTAQHIADKYAQLARDAQASGDPVAAENYFQHAEHYYRIIAAAQEQYRQQFGGQRPFDEEGEDGDDEMALPNGAGYGHPGERLQGTPNGMPGNGEYYDPGSQPQPFESERPARFDRGSQDRSSPDRAPDRGARFERGERRDRFQRPDRPQRPERQDFQAGEGTRPADGARSGDGSRSERPRDDRQEFRRERRREEASDQPAGLPAFLTNPARQPIAVDEAEEGTPAAAPEAPAGEPEAAGGEVNGRYAVRPRRRRRPRFEGEAPGAETPGLSPESADTPGE